MDTQTQLKEKFLEELLMPIIIRQIDQKMKYITQPLLNMIK